MKKTIGILMVTGLGLVSAQGQNEMSKRGLPFLKESDVAVLDLQAEGMFKAVRPLVSQVNKHAVQVEYRGEMITLGTVTSAGVVTKWSEIRKLRDQLSILGSDGVRREVVVKSVYRDYDLAVLDYRGELAAVDFIKASEPGVGSFLVLAGPGEGARGLGVVSVGTRSLREQDKAFLGVRMGLGPIDGGGVQLQNVESDSAAERGGLKAGDVVKRINDRVVNGLLEMGSVLQRMSPGDVVDLAVVRGDKEFIAKVTLGARPQLRGIRPERMDRMRTMGGSVNAVGEGFPDVIQSDMQIDARESGGPVFDLDGNFVGVVVARSSRIKTYIVPAAKLADVLAGKPDLTSVRAGEDAR